MINFKNNVYAVALIVSFILLLSSILLSYKNISNSTTTLKHLSKDQITLNYYTNKLNYDIKKSQTEILQTTLLHGVFTQEQEDISYREIKKSIEKLEEFIQGSSHLSEEFMRTLKTISLRSESFKIVQHSLIEAIAAKDREDIEDALIGFDSISKEFDKDAALLIELANMQLYERLFELTKNNNKGLESLIFSFLISVLLIGFSAYRFFTLQKQLQHELERAQSAEDSLQSAQKQLLQYNDDLEAEIEKKTQELHAKIYTHSLSGLPNRSKLLNDLPLYKFSYLAILNIDKFQAFNDVYGEATGNIAITASAEFLQEYIKTKSLFLYHIGGDEFVVAGEDNSLFTQQIFIEEIEKILKSYRTNSFVFKEKNFQFIMSAGISFHGKRKILAYADMALKDAKKRNIQLSVFNDESRLEKAHQEHIECKKKLMYALENDGILSYYQPIVPIQDLHQVTKYESLVRLRDEDGKIIPPVSFLQEAKSNRVYYKITKQVLINTLATIQKYHIPCSINFSLQDVENERSMAYFFELLDNFEHNKLITIELLETEEFKNYKLVYDFCVKVRSYGVKVALDDFGSGYSNFSHILQLPVDYIKIDASLISNIDRDLSSQIMVETIVDLAHKLNVLTIAEFVSSEEILTVIKDLGVDYAQGFYFGKPLEINEYIQIEDF